MTEKLVLTDGQMGMTKSMTGSKIGARLVSRGLASCQTAATYSPQIGAERVEMTDMISEATELVDAVKNRNRTEMLLINQMTALDAMFNNMAQRAYKADYMDNMATYMKLALKCQAQARCTAEALAMIQNPQPYIRQTNIANGHQQVNTYATTSVCNDRAEKFDMAQSKLMENGNERLDTRAQGKAVRGNQAMEAVGTQYRRKNTRRQSKGGEKPLAGGAQGEDA